MIFAFASIPALLPLYQIERLKLETDLPERKISFGL